MKTWSPENSAVRNWGSEKRVGYVQYDTGKYLAIMAIE